MELPQEIAEMGLPFANQINKKLQTEVSAKELEIKFLQSQIEDHGERVQALRDHRQNVLQELQHTQALYDARRRDHGTEDHLKQLAEREDGRLNATIKQSKSELDNIKEQMNTYENNMYRILQEMNGIKTQMKMDQVTLNAYLERSAEKDDDAMIIQRYARQDEAKIKELTLKIQNLQENLAKSRRELDRESTETISAQISLDKTAEEFRRMHSQRQELLGQWEDTIAQMKKRDEDMERTANALSEVRSEIRDKEEVVGEKKEFLEEEKRNAEEVEKKVNMSERQSAKLRLDLQDAETKRIQFKDELETLKYSVDRTASDLESTRAQCTVLGRQEEERMERLRTYQAQRRALQEEMRKKTKGLLSAEERAQEMDELLTIEETNVTRIEKELGKTREKQFKKSQRLFELRQGESVLSAELHGCRVASKNLVSKQRVLDQEALKQQEILYTQDFQIQQQERKVGRMLGDRSEEEQALLNQKLKSLEAESSSQLQEEALLTAQLKKLQDDLRQVGRALERTSASRDQLVGGIGEVNLHIDSTQREIRSLIASKQGQMVDENILKLEVRRLREQLFSHSDEVHSLERKKLQLHTAMSERTKEIDIHKEMLRGEIKAVEAERQTASTEVHDRLAKVERLRKRYEIVLVTMAPPEGEEERSAAYYVIKAAQEREELQRRGDELDAKIQTSEREIKALENTLKLMTARNTNYRATLTKVDAKGEELTELEQLEGKLQTLLNKFKHKKRDLKQLKEDSKTMSTTLTNLSTNEDVFATLVEERKKGLTGLQREIDEQKRKTDRVQKQSLKLQRSLREKKGQAQTTPEEADMSVRELRTLNLSLTQALAQLGSYHRDVGEPLRRMFAEANIPPPATPTATPSGSRASSRPPSSLNSSCSSLSSARSGVSRSGPTPIQPKALEIGMSPSSSHDRLSSRSSSSSVAGKKTSSSRASSKHSSRHSSRISLSSRPPSKTTLDLFIGPSH